MNDTFLAIFLANKTGARMTAWNALSKEARHTKMQEGVAAWKAWRTLIGGAPMSAPDPKRTL
jgi:hypothetical protein